MPKRSAPKKPRVPVSPAPAAGPVAGALVVHPLTPDRWPHLEQLFGPQGAVKGCWCLWWRFTPRDYDRAAPETRRAALQTLVNDGHEPGLLAYAGSRPVGWCSVAPREQFLRLRTSATWRPIDTLTVPVWSIVCYFIAPGVRRQQVATRLLAAAIDYARQHGAAVIEAYPKDTTALPGPHPDERLHFGTASMYRAAGFQEVARRNPAFPIVRLRLK